jgi:hypothetical protein
MLLESLGESEMSHVGEVVGRGSELERLSRLIDGAFEDGGALMVIGDPGIGKSTLLQAAADHADAAGFLVLATTGVESEAALPYAGLYELFRPALNGIDALPTAQRDALFKAFGIEVGSGRSRSWSRLQH